MHRPEGYIVITEPGKSTIEADTAICNHCNSIVRVDPRMDPMLQTQFRVIEASMCRGCMKHVCPVCMGKVEAGDG